MLNIIWEFHCKPERQAEFENIYKPDGKWSQLFSCSPGYQGTTLIRDQNQPCRYLCADHWDDLTSFQAFKDSNADDYTKLDRLCEELTVKESCLGYFDSL